MKKDRFFDGDLNQDTSLVLNQPKSGGLGIQPVALGAQVEKEDFNEIVD